MVEELGQGCLENASRSLLFAAERARVHISSAIDLCSSGFDLKGDARDFFYEGRQAVLEVCSADADLEKQDAAVKWHTWAEQAMLRGSGKAHRWTKLPTAWQPFRTKVVMPWAGLPHKQIAAEGERLEKLWEASPSQGRGPWSCKSWGPVRQSAEADESASPQTSCTPLPLIPLVAFVRSFGHLVWPQLKAMMDVLLLPRGSSTMMASWWSLASWL